MLLIFFFKNSKFILIFAVILGSYWASQEFNWGGYWAWDFIEVSIGLFVVVYIYIYHSIYKSKGYGFYVLYALILLFFFLKSFNINSIHSFVLVQANLIVYLGFCLTFFFFLKNYMIRLFLFLYIVNLFLDINAVNYIIKYSLILLFWVGFFKNLKQHKIILIFFMFLVFFIKKIFNPIIFIYKYSYYLNYMDNGLAVSFNMVIRGILHFWSNLFYFKKYSNLFIYNELSFIADNSVLI